MIKTANLQNEIINLSNELVMVDNVNLPFSSLLLNKGTDKISSIYATWKNENLDPSKKLSLEGGDITEFQTSARTTDKNICQIITKGVNISDTANVVGLEGINDLFTHELQNRMTELKRDLEHYLINGVYTEENGATPRQMKGLINFVTEDNKIKFGAGGLSGEELTNACKLMRKNGTSSQNLILLCDYLTTDAINQIFVDKVRYMETNEFGLPVLKINFAYGSAYIYTVDSLPENTCLMVNMDYLSLGELRPLIYNDLAKTGDSRKGYIVCENTLKVTNPNAVVMVYGDPVSTIALNSTKTTSKASK